MFLFCVRQLSSPLVNSTSHVLVDLVLSCAIVMRGIWNSSFMELAKLLAPNSLTVVDAHLNQDSHVRKNAIIVTHQETFQKPIIFRMFADTEVLSS